MIHKIVTFGFGKINRDFPQKGIKKLYSVFVNDLRRWRPLQEVKFYNWGVYNMKIKRVFQTKEGRTLDEIFNELVRSYIDIIIENSYDVGVNTATSQEGKNTNVKLEM